MKKMIVLLLSTFLFGFSTASINIAPKEKQSNESIRITNKLERLMQNNNNNMRSSENALYSEAFVTPRDKLSKDETTYLAVAEMNSAASATNFYSVKQSFLVTDFSKNEYLFTTFSPYGSSVISMFNYTTVEVNYFDTDDYSGISETDNLKYIPGTGLYQLNGNTYENVISDRHFPVKNAQVAEESSSIYIDYMGSQYNSSLKQKITLLNNGGGGGGNKDWDVSVTDNVITADIEVPHSWFFKYNTSQFSYKNGGSNGICEYIAFLMMMSYNDFFCSAGYFSDDQISTYVSTVSSKSFESSIPIIDDNWCKDLFTNNNSKETLTADDLNALSDNFLSGKGVSYRNVWAYWTFGNPKDVIQNGKRPDMLSGKFPDTGNRGEVAHNIVAYGVFTSGTYKNKYLTHYGWDAKTQCIVDRPFLSAYDWSVVNNSSHVHRYIFNVNGEMKCGCEY